ncbi:MAG: hypothetical protein U0575_02715 [Phycisphaerales bacterium]
MNTRITALGSAFAAITCTLAFAVGGNGNMILSQTHNAALDTGDQGTPSGTDNDGSPLVIDNGGVFPPVAIDPSAFDLDDDAVVDMNDVVATILAWGTRGPSPADFNGDGMVDAADLGLLLAAFGTTVTTTQDQHSASDGGVLPPTDCIGCDNDSVD